MYSLSNHNYDLQASCVVSWYANVNATRLWNVSRRSCTRKVSLQCAFVHVLATCHIGWILWDRTCIWTASPQYVCTCASEGCGTAWRTWDTVCTGTALRRNAQTCDVADDRSERTKLSICHIWKVFHLKRFIHINIVSTAGIHRDDFIGWFDGSKPKTSVVSLFYFDSSLP